MKPAADLPPLRAALDAIGADQAQQHEANLRDLLSRMAQFGTDRGDPVRTVPAFLGDRWSSLVMHLLKGGMLRHGELRKLICLISAEQDISQRMLTLKLRVLERDGLIHRTVTDDVPPRVEYRLSTLGQESYAHFSALVRWAEAASAAVRQARATYDAQHPDGPALQREAAGRDG